MQMQFGKSIGAINVCYKIDESHDRPQVWVHEEIHGDAGRVLGFGCGDTVDNAIESATDDAKENLSRGAR